MVFAGRFACLLALCAAGSVAGCGDSSTSTASLSSADVHGSASLSAAERKRHVAYCVSLKDKFIRAQKVTSSKQSRDERFDEQVDRACNCIVDAFESRSSKMQFLMIMESLGRIKQALIEGNDNSAMAPFKVAAARHGMSPEDFDRTRRQAGEIANSAITNCGRYAQLNR